MHVGQVYTTASLLIPVNIALKFPLRSRQSLLAHQLCSSSIGAEKNGQNVFHQEQNSVGKAQDPSEAIRN